MKKFIKENWFKLSLLFMTLFVIFFSVYWLQLRPAHIKKECSWVKKHLSVIPEFTQKQADEKNAKCLEEKKSANDNGVNLKSGNIDFRKFLPAKNCDEKPYAAQPEKTWYERASSAEYQFCIHSRGL